MRSLPIQLCPLERSMTSSVRAGSRPTRSASASASAAPARLIGASRLLTSLVRAPSPARSPSRNTGSASSPSNRRAGRRPHRDRRPSGSSFRHARAPVRPTSAPRSSRCRARRAAPRTTRRSRARSSDRGRRRCPAPRARDAVAAEQHRLGLRRIDDGDDHHALAAASAAGVAQTCAPAPARALRGGVERRGRRPRGRGRAGARPSPGPCCRCRRRPR